MERNRVIHLDVVDWSEILRVMSDDNGDERETLRSKRQDTNPEEKSSSKSGAAVFPPPRNERGPGWTRPPAWTRGSDAVVFSVSEPGPNGMRTVYVARHGVWRDGHAQLPDRAARMVGVVFDYARLTATLGRKKMGRDPGVPPRKVQSVEGWLLELRAEGGKLYARVDIEGESWRVPVARDVFDEVRKSADAAAARTHEKDTSKLA